MQCLRSPTKTLGACGTWIFPQSLLRNFAKPVEEKLIQRTSGLLTPRSETQNWWGEPFGRGNGTGNCFDIFVGCWHHGRHSITSCWNCTFELAKPQQTTGICGCSSTVIALVPGAATVVGMPSLWPQSTLFRQRGKMPYWLDNLPATCCHSFSSALWKWPEPRHQASF